MMKVMKKIYFIIVAAVMLAGCTAGLTNDAVTTEEMVKIRVSTVNPPEIVGTRTMLDENLDVKWHKGDEIIMVAQNPEGGEMLGRLTNVYEDGYEGLFEGEVPKAWISNTTVESAVYSYKTTEWATANGYTVSAGDWGRGFLSITLPSQQPMVPGTFARDCNLSAATFELNDDVTQVYFHNLCGLLRVSLKGNADIKSMKITAPSKINGSFSLNTNYHVGRETEYTLILVDKGSSDNVTLVAEEKIGLTSEPQSFYACVLPENIRLGSEENAGPGAGEYQIAVTTVEGKVVTKTVSVEKGIAAGRCADLGELEVNYTFADASDIEFNPAGGSVELKYLPSGDMPVVTGVPEWITYTVSGDKLTFASGLYVGESVRTADVTITQGPLSATITFKQSPAATLKLSSVYSDADAHTGYEIEKTEYLSSDYTLEESIDWLTATKNDAGNILLSVEANATGAIRYGTVEVKVGDVTAGTVNVTQTMITYASLIGNHDIAYREIDNSVKNVTGGWETIAVTERTAGIDYTVAFKWEWRDMSFVFDYVPIGPGCMSLTCPQASGMYTDGNANLPFIRAARKHSNSSFRLTTANYVEIDLAEEGCGFDLVPVIEENVVTGYDYVPNLKSQGLYPEGVDGLWFPEYEILTKDEAGVALTWKPELKHIKRYMRPLDGQEYLRMTKKK